MTDHPKTLGWIVGPPDERDYDLASFAAPTLTLSGERRWHYPSMPDLDQGVEGACTCFAFANALNANPRKRSLHDSYAFARYHAVTEWDDIKGDWRSGQEGAYLRDAAKEYQRRGKLDAYAFTYSVEQIVSWLLSNGPMTIGVEWWSSMDHPRPDDDYYARVGGTVRGRHAVALVGAHWGLGDGNYVVLQNSWSKAGYGYQGRARISEDGLRKLMEDRYATALTFVDSAERGR